MYRLLKHFVKSILPKTTLYKYEDKIRSLIYVFYIGDQVQCNICEKKLKSFIKLKSGDKLCPYCGSLARDRRLWSISHEFLSVGMKVLDFSPSRNLYKKFKQNKLIQYFSTDISGDFLADFSLDITKLDLENNSLDLIICYHILEHVENDILAMNELYRVLKQHGVCLIQTPFKEGGIYEDSTIVSEKDRLLHFDQEDHVRIYSVHGLESRLTNAGFNVKVRNYTEKPENVNGFKVIETVLVCRK